MDVASCYKFLSILQSEYEIVEGEFDDYIAAPKPNGYMSILPQLRWRYSF